MKEVFKAENGGSLCEVKTVSGSEKTMVVFPGGGYVELCDYEGEPIAERFSELGYNAYVMNYPVVSNGGNRTDELLEDVHEAINYIKEKLNGTDVILTGFSAGGNLIANYGNRYDDVDCLILCYAVVDWQDLVSILSTDTGIEAINSRASKLRDGGFVSLFGTTDVTEEMLKSVSPIISVTEKSVPAFIWQSQKDTLVSVEKTIKYYLLLTEKNIPAELHIYKDGQHGMGLGENTEVSSWVMLADSFIKSLEK